VSAAMRSRNLSGKGPRVVTGAGLAAGLAAIVASSCCVLPLVFVGLGMGSFAAILIPALAALRPYLLGAGALAVVTAWIIYVRRRRACAAGKACEIPGAAGRGPVWLAIASTTVFIAFIWQPWIEPLLLRWMR